MKKFTIALLLLIILVTNNAILTNPAIITTQGAGIGHQIYYGEWIVTKHITGGRFEPEADIEKYFGEIIEYSARTIKLNGEIIAEAPIYLTTIVNIEERAFFNKYLYPDNDADVFAVDSPYFASIAVKNLQNFSDGEADYSRFCEFYVKDADTLVLRHFGGLLEMKRVSYPEGYLESIGGV